MTKYSYNGIKDKKLIEQSFNNIAYLIFGTNQPDKIKKLKKLFELEVKEVNIYPQGTRTKHISTNTPGICRLDESDNKLIIEMLGYEGQNLINPDFTRHEGTHEFCHAFADFLPKIFSKNKDGIIKDGVKRQNHMGMIKETDARTGKFVGHNYYGKMFNETMMDIISSIGINAFDSKSNKIDEILTQHYTSWGNASTGYSIFTSITRLAIAAFSNNGNVSYSNLVKNGSGGIFNVTTQYRDGNKYMANDFMYGILYDPLHIEQQYDKFANTSNYRDLCHHLDRMFITYQNTRQINSKDVKLVMTVLADFLNAKCNYYLKNNIMTQEQVNAIIYNFNRVWNSLQNEYTAFFTEEEINGFARRAGR